MGLSPIGKAPTKAWAVENGSIAITAATGLTGGAIELSDVAQGTGTAAPSLASTTSITSGYIGNTFKVTANPTTGYQLKSGTLKVGENEIASGGTYEITELADKRVTAEFEKIPYSLSLATATQDYADLAANPASAGFGETSSVTITPKTGYKFTSAFIANPPVTVTGNGDTGLSSAAATSDSYTATFSFGAAGTASNATLSIDAAAFESTYPVNAINTDNLTLTAAPTAGGVGDTITVTAAPKVAGSGYTLSGISYSYTDKQGMLQNKSKDATSGTSASFTIPTDIASTSGVSVTGLETRNVPETPTGGTTSPSGVATFNFNGIDWYFASLSSAVTAAKECYVKDVTLRADAPEAIQGSNSIDITGLNIELDGHAIKLTASTDTAYSSGAGLQVYAASGQGAVATSITDKAGTGSITAAGIDAAISVGGDSATDVATLNLGASTISTESTTTGTLLAIGGNGKVVSTVKKYDTKGASASATDGVIELADSAELAMESGEISGAVTTAASHVLYGISAAGTSKVTLGKDKDNGPTIAAHSGAVYAVGTASNSCPTVTIEGGAYKATYAGASTPASGDANTSTALNLDDFALVTVNAGAFEGGTSAVTSDVTTARDGDQKLISGLTINGGTYKYRYADGGLTTDTYRAILNISGATAITGGTFGVSDAQGASTNLFVTTTAPANISGDDTVFYVKANLDAANVDATKAAVDASITSGHTFKVLRSLAGATVEAPAAKVTYNGADQTPAPVAKWGEAAIDSSWYTVKFLPADDGTTQYANKATALGGFGYSGSTYTAGSDKSVEAVHNAGEYWVKLTANSRATGYKEGSFVVSEEPVLVVDALDIASDLVKIGFADSTDTTTAAKDYNYAGNYQMTLTTGSLTPKVAVMVGNDVLASGTDYEAIAAASFDPNPLTVTDAAKVKVTAKGGNLATVEAGDQPSKIATFKVVGDNDNHNIALAGYTGKFNIGGASTATGEGTDYGIDAGGKVNYTGAAYKATQLPTFTCPVNESQQPIFADFRLGSEYKLTVNGPGITEDTNIAVVSDLPSMTNAGTYTYTFEGVAPFYGKRTFTFNVAKLNLAASDTTITDKLTTVNYVPSSTGAFELVPADLFDVKTGTTPVAVGTNIIATPPSVTKAGAFSVKLTGTGNFTGTVTRNVTVTAAGIDAVDNPAAQDYTGEAQDPASLTVKYYSGVTYGTSTALVKGRDYNVTYEKKSGTGASATYTSITGSPVDAGTYRGTVKGINGFNNYNNKTVTFEFTINPIALTDTTNYAVNVERNIDKVAPAVDGTSVDIADYYDITIADVVTGKLIPFKQGIDYALSPSKATDVSTTFSVVGMGANFTGVDAGNVFTRGAGVLSVAATASMPSLTYNGYDQSGSLVVTNKAGGELVKGSDYTVMFYAGAKDDYTDKITYDKSAAVAVENAGYYEAVIVGQGSYAGEATEMGQDANITLDFEVAKLDISTLTLHGATAADKPTVKFTATSYTGTAHSPAIDAGNSVINYTDSKDQIVDLEGDIEGAEITNAGAQKVALVAKKASVNYTGTNSAETYDVDVATLDLSSATVKFVATVNGVEKYMDDFTGKAGDTPAVKLFLNYGAQNESSLATGDYDVAYKDNTAAGTATVTVTAKGVNITADTRKDKTYTIADVGMDSATLSLNVDSKSQPFKGAAYDIKPTVSLSGGNLVPDVDYKLYVYGPDGKELTLADSKSASIGATTAGDYTFVAYGLKYYGQTAADTFTVAKLSLKDTDNITITQGNGINKKSLSDDWAKSYAYGEEVVFDDINIASASPKVASLNETTDGKNGDYSVAYANNVDAGTATVTFTGMGNYTDSVTKTFTVEPIDITSIGLDLQVVFTNAKEFSNFINDEVTYTGSAVEPTFKVYNDDGLEFAGAKTVTYKNNVNVAYPAFGAPIPQANAYVEVTATGNYTGTIYGPFTIVPVDLATAKNLSVEVADTEYTGEIAKPKATVKLGDIVLTQDKDFTVESSDINVGAASAKIIPVERGNCTASAEIVKAFNIQKTSQTIKASATTAKFAYNKSAAVKISGQKTALKVTTSGVAKAAEKNGTITITATQAGAGKVTVQAVEDGNLKASNSVTIDVAAGQVANTAKVAVAKGKSKKKATTVKANKKKTIKSVISVSGAQGKVTLANRSTSKVAKSFKLAYKNGKVNVTVPAKKVKAGKTYALKVQVKAAGDTNHTSFTSKTVTVYVKGKK